MSFGRNIGVETNQIDVTESNTAVRFTDEEIRVALKFMVLAPISNSQKELRTIIVSVIFELNIILTQLN